MIAGQPVITVETKRGHVDIPFALSGDVLVQGNGVVVQTEDGSVVVSLKEFEVVVANGQVMLVAEVNPLFLIPIAFYGLGGAAAGAGLVAVLGGTKTAIIGGAIGGAIVGGAYGATRR